MLRRILTSSILMCALVILGLFRISGVSAHSVSIHAILNSETTMKTSQSLNCPYPVSGTNAIARGSTSANVNMTIWKDCSGQIFVSANSFRDANGFAFTGWVGIKDTSNQSHTSYCSGSGVCNSPHVSAVIGDIGGYQTNNGIFYYLNGQYTPGGIISFGANYVG